MNRSLRLAALAGAGMFAVHPAFAHAVGGARVFLPTLTIDDPGVSDEASLPTFQYQRSDADEESSATREYDFGFEYDKTITPNFGIGIEYGWDVFQAEHAKTATGFENLAITGKYKVYVNAAHEFIASVGVTREFGGTGTLRAGADRFGSTAPTLYFGKGLGEVPIGYLRALGITGELTYSIADVGLKTTRAVDPDTGLTSFQYNDGDANQWAAGVSLQYSMPYLKAQVRDLGLPEFFNRLTPLIEITWSSPATRPSAEGTQWLFAPGVIYQADSWDVGVEALIPGNRATGTNVGVIAQFHLFLDDLFPNSIGQPIFQ
jgi:hypothetical protein